MVNLQNNIRLNQNQMEKMLIMNGRRSPAGVTWRDYVKYVWNLKGYAIDFFYGIEFKW